MRAALKINWPDGKTVDVKTNLWCVCEWERTEGRKLSDGRGIGLTDLACWAWFMLKADGHQVDTSWQKWIQANPDLEITSVDETEPNPTVSVPTADSLPAF